MQLAHLHIEASNGKLSAECADRGIISFLSFLEWVEQLPYKRNSNRENYNLVFDEECGTCSTKHALIKAVATENKWDFVKLYIGIYKMNKATNPGVANVLAEHQLNYLPEAHTYLKINDEIADRTGLRLGKIPFHNVLLTEIEIDPHQIGQFKIDWHKNYINTWAIENQYNPSKIWAVREACIAALEG